MKNREKFAKELVEVALNDDILAVNKNTGMVVTCSFTDCGDCLFKGDCNSAARNAWAESEWGTITAERLYKEFNKLCLNTDCGECSYRAQPHSLCFSQWILDNYNITEKGGAE